MDTKDKMDKIIKSEEEWRKELTPQQYHVTREKGTEAPFSGEFWNTHDKGMFMCSNCGLELFSSDTKFDSGTGWPSFDSPVNRENVELVSDDTHGMRRTEVVCRRCQAHLGHLFDDGPTATGQRFCINSCSLKMKKSDANQ